MTNPARDALTRAVNRCIADGAPVFTEIKPEPAKLEPQFTKGGFARNISPASRFPIIFAGRNTHVAMVLTKGIPDAEAEANCNLIAAADRLYEALVEIEEHAKLWRKASLGNRGLALDEIAEKCAKAIRRAHGIYE